MISPRTLRISQVVQLVAGMVMFTATLAIAVSQPRDGLHWVTLGLSALLTVLAALQLWTARRTPGRNPERR